MVEEGRMASQAAVCLGKEAEKAGATGKEFHCFWRDFSSQIWCFFKNCSPEARCCVKGISWSLEFRAFQFLSPQLCPAALRCCCSTCARAQGNPFLLFWGFSAASWFEGLLSWEFSFPSRSTGFSTAKESLFTSADWRQDDAYGKVELLAVLRCDWEDFKQK